MTTIPPPPPRRQPDALFSVLVVENDPTSRQAIAAWLRTMGAGTIHLAATLTQARAHARAIDPDDLAILNLALPDGPGIDLVTELHNRGWPRIVVLANPEDPDSVPAAFHAGAHAYLLTSPTPTTPTNPRPPDSNPTTNPNGMPIPTIFAPPGEAVSTPYGLTLRELDVLQLVAHGHSNHQIGTTLHLSALTVKTHLTRIGRKLHTGNRAHMITLAMRAGIIH